ncbi:MAG: HNH endonuclease signature motif containing protein [Sulfurimonas sp.]
MYKRDKASTKIYNSRRWRDHTRPKVILRDNYRCVSCGCIGRSIDLIVDHIEEIKDGGDPYNMNNLQTLCRSCHNTKTEDQKRKRDNGEISTSKTDRSDHGVRFI